MSESEEIEIVNKNQLQSNDVTIEVTEESEVSSQVNTSEDPVWKQIRGIRKELALLNRRSGRQELKKIEVEAAVESEVENAVETKTKQIETPAVVNRGALDSIFRRWR